MNYDSTSKSIFKPSRKASDSFKLETNAKVALEGERLSKAV